MTSEEKADDIIDKFSCLVYLDKDGKQKTIVNSYDNCIKCALIVVDEVLEAIKYIEKDNTPYYELVPEGQEFEWHYISYWNKVRETLKEQL